MGFDEEATLKLQEAIAENYLAQKQR